MILRFLSGGSMFHSVYICIANSFKVKRLRDFKAIWVYLFVMGYALVASKFKEPKSAKEVWKFRVKR